MLSSFEGMGLMLLEQKEIRPNKIHSCDLVKQDKLKHCCESGNAANHEKLSEATDRNKKVRPNKMQGKKKAEKPLHPSGQRRWIEKQQGRTKRDNQSNDNDGEDAFGDSFGAVPLLDMTSHQAHGLGI
jgi:hypothetical protein